MDGPPDHEVNGAPERAPDPVAQEGGSDTIRRPEDPSSGRPGSIFAQFIQQAAPFMAAAWMMTAALLLGVFGGRWIDAKLGTSPLFVLVGSALGMAIGFRELIRAARHPGVGSRENDSGGD